MMHRATLKTTEGVLVYLDLNTDGSMTWLEAPEFMQEATPVSGQSIGQASSPEPGTATVVPGGLDVSELQMGPVSG